METLKRKILSRAGHKFGGSDRQYGRSLEYIRPDHVKRYFFAGDNIQRGSTVLDAACGCGYGSWLLMGADLKVTGVDIEAGALEYARKYYQGPEYRCQRVEDMTGRFDVLVSFETLEHLEKPEELLRAVETKKVIASVPNQLLLPFDASRYSGDQYPHKRHYTPDEFEELLETSGHPVKEKFCQQDRLGDVIPGTDGIFLIYICE